MPFGQEKYDTRTNNQSVKEFESSHSCHFGGAFLAAATWWPVTDCNNGALKRHTRLGKENVVHCVKTKTLHYLRSHAFCTVGMSAVSTTACVSCLLY